MNEDALKAKLKVIASEKALTFNQVWKQLLLERFLARLSNSNHHDKFIFKDGLLLANYINIGRETMDIDFSLTKLNASTENIKSVIQDIISYNIDDNVLFTWGSIKELVHPHMKYDGFRIFLCAAFGKMTDKIQIDIGIGDQVKPKQREYFPFEYKGKPIFSGEISLLVYPPENIFAEKFESIVSRGAFNSRMKDYHDVLLMIREPKLLEKVKLQSAIQKIFEQRDTILEYPVVLDEDGINSLQQLWANHLRGLGEYKYTLEIPDDFNALVEELVSWLSLNEVI